LKDHSNEEAWDLVCEHFSSEPKENTLPEELTALEKRRIKDALQYYGGNRTKAAKDLGIGRTLLIHKIKKYSLFK
tara:strand:- start:265 stop:489 length:225 start_codon:yes stop_codon:yes gene_type:complete